MCKITPASRKVFMLQYRTNAGERRKPSLGLYGEHTVEQARSLAKDKHLISGEYYSGWSRVLKAADAAHVGTHGIRSRSAIDIGNSGISVKVGMALAEHKTVAIFMCYVHTEDEPVRKATELVTKRRLTVVMGKSDR